MKITCLLFGGLSLTGILSSCNKKDNPVQQAWKQSYWMVNNDTIAYNNIHVHTAPSLSEIRVLPSFSSHPSEIAFAFTAADLPRYGTYKVDYVASYPMMCNVYVIYKGDRYDVSAEQNNTRLEIRTLPDGKGQYKLQPTWFYQHLSPGDSILVRAVIIEP